MQEVLRELVDMLTPTVQVSPEATVAHGSELISLALAVFLRSFQSKSDPAHYNRLFFK